MSHALQQHGRDIAGGFLGVSHHQGTGCGEVVSILDSEEEAPEGLSRTEQIGFAVGLLLLLIGGAVAVGGG